MPFDVIETSLDLGQPIRLYKFSRGVIVWAYNSSDRDVTYQGKTYKTLAGGISDNGIRQTGQGDADSLEITAYSGIEVAQLFRGIGPSSPIELTVIDVHAGDYSEALIAYMGAIQSVKFPSEDTCKIICTTDDVSLDQIGLRLTWGRACPHVLYERGCLVNRDLFKAEGAIGALTGLSITLAAAAGFDDGWFSGGYVEWSIGSGQYEQRNIESHTGSNLVLLAGTSGLLVGKEVAIFAGCDHSIQTCNDKFNNLPNYGGQPHQPGVSPFVESPF